MTKRFWIVGHRGSPTVEVENTLRSFERAVDVEGANALEMDICVTRDRELVVWHDFDPNGLDGLLRRFRFEPDVRCLPRSCGKRLCDVTLDAARRDLGYVDRKTDEKVDAHIPTLAEVFTWSRSHPRLGLVFLDLKVPKDRCDLIPVFLARLDEVIKRTNPRIDIVIECSHLETVEALRRHGARYALALDVMPPPGVVLDEAKASAVDTAIRHGLSWATAQKPRPITLFPFKTHRRIVTRDRRRLLEHNRVAPSSPIHGLCAFTINDPEEMRVLLDIGVNAIQSDVPGVLRDVVARRMNSSEPIAPMLAPISAPAATSPGK